MSCLFLYSVSPEVSKVQAEEKLRSVTPTSKKLNEDAIMTSPSGFYFVLLSLLDARFILFLVQVPAQGSSRSTGGLFRNRALGNQPNLADLEEEQETNISRPTAQKGKVILYHQPDDPKPRPIEDMKVACKLTVNVSFLLFFFIFSI